MDDERLQQVLKGAWLADQDGADSSELCDVIRDNLPSGARVVFITDEEASVMTSLGAAGPRGNDLVVVDMREKAKE